MRPTKHQHHWNSQTGGGGRIHPYPLSSEERAGPASARQGTDIQQKKDPQRTHAQCARKAAHRQNWQQEQEWREKGTLHASCLAVCQCLLSREVRDEEQWRDSIVTLGRNADRNSSWTLSDAAFTARLLATSLSCSSQPSDGEWWPFSLCHNKTQWLLLTLLHAMQSQAEHWDCQLGTHLCCCISVLL